MSVMFVALPLALLLGGLSLWACIACVRSGQYDDLETPAVRILIADRDQSTEQELADELSASATKH